MHVVVVGCGRVGSELAGELEKQSHTVAIVDKNPHSFRRLSPSFGGRRIAGLGFDRDVLLDAGIETAGALAAVTNGDNSNILVARIARETFGIDNVAARIYDPRRARIYQRLGITTVATVSWTTDQVLRRLLPGEHRSEWVDQSNNVGLVEVTLPPALAGHRLDELNVPGRILVTGVSRLGEAQVATPELVGQEGDVVMLMAATDALDELHARLEPVTDGGGH